MPQFTIEDAQTGRRITVEGETEPTPSEMEELFATYQQPAEPQPSDEAMRMSRVLRGEEIPRNPMELDAANLQRRSLGPGLGFAEEAGTFRPPGIYDTLMTPLVDVAKSVTGQDVANLTDVLRVMGTSQATTPEQIKGEIQAELESPYRAPSPTEQRIAGAQQAAAGLANSFTSPVGLATLGLGVAPAAIQKGAGLVFAGDMLRQIPEQARVAGEATVTGTPEQEAAALASLGLSAAGVGALTKPMAAEAISRRIPGTPENVRSMLDRQIAETELPNIDAQAVKDLALPARPAPEPMIPEVARTRQLVDQALKEATGEKSLINPNEPLSALELLKRQTEPQVIAAERPPARTDIEGGKASFRQGAEGTASVIPEPSVEAFQREITAPSQLPGLIRGRGIERWADNTIAESKGRTNLGVDPTLLGAYAVKAASLVERGVVEGFEAFKTEFERRFPEAAQHAKEVWNRLTASDDAIMEKLNSTASPKDLSDAVRDFGGSLTSVAYRIGGRTDTPAKLTKIQDLQSKWAAKAKESLRAGNFEESAKASYLSQFYREAYEYATGTASAGAHQVRQMPGYEPPMLDRAGRQQVVESLRARGIEVPEVSGFERSIDAAIKALAPDQSKVMEGVTGLPVWLTKEAARAALIAVREVYTATKSGAKAVAEGVRWLRENGIKASEADMRDWLSTQLESPKEAAPVAAQAPRQRAAQAGISGEDVLKRVDQIFTPEAKESVPLKTRLKQASETLRTNWSSKFRPLDKLAEDLSAATGAKLPKTSGIFEALRGSSGKAEADLYRFDSDVTRLVRGLEPEFNQYLFMRRTLDRLESDIRDASINTPSRRKVAELDIPQMEAGLQALEAKIGPDAARRLEVAAQAYQSHMDGALRRQVDSGRMSQQVYDSIKNGNQFYAPFKLLKYLEASTAPEGSGRRIDTTAEYTKAIKGIEDPGFKLGDIMTASKRNIVMSRILSEKNVAMQQLQKVLAADQSGTFVRKLGSDEAIPANMEAVNVMNDGVVTRYAVDPSVAESVNNWNGRINDTLGDFFAKMAAPFRAGVTTGNVAFQAVNLAFADLPRAALVSKFGIKAGNPADYLRYPMDFVESMFASMKPGANKLYLDYLESGAAGSTVQEYLTPTAFEPKTKTKAFSNSVLDSVPKFARAVEEVNKVLGVKRAMRETGAQSGAELARNFPDAITEIRRFSGSPDFGRIGKKMDAMRLNVLFMFPNARIQGAIADIGRLFGRDGKATAAKTWGKVMTAVGVPTAILYYMNSLPQYREDYEKRPEWEKQNYWLVPRDSYVQGENGEMVRDYWRIPKRETAKLVGNLVESSLKFAETKDPAGAWDFGVDALENLSPVNIEGNSLQQRLESVASSLNPIFTATIESGTGRSLFRHRDIVPDFMQNASPEQQYLDRTPELFRKLAEAMPDATPDMLRSPLMLENLVRNFTGSLLTQFIPNKPTPGREGAMNNPLMRRFQSVPYTDTEKEQQRIQELKRESVDEFLARHRIAQKAVAEATTVESAVKAAIAAGGANEKLVQHTIDLFIAEQNNLTAIDRQVLKLPTAQRAAYIIEELNKVPAAERKALLLDTVKKRILTEGVIEEMGAE